MERISVPPHILDICRKFDDNGFECVIVGGAVRDSAIGREVHDWDLACSATPNEMRAIFGDRIRSNNGDSHGTVLILAGEDAVEVTTFRSDSFCDGRHAVVTFTRNIIEDLSRRDFTFNSMAWNPITQDFIDPFNGLLDLRLGIVRFVGEGLERIAEDHLRAFRALRFAAMLGGGLAQESEDALILAHASGMLDVGQLSIERVRDELLKTLVYGERGLRLWQVYGLMNIYLPEVAALRGLMQNTHHSEDAFNHTLHAVENARVTQPHAPLSGDLVGHLGMDAPTAALVALRLTLLFHDIGKALTGEFEEGYGNHFYKHEAVGADMTAAICKRFKMDNELTELVCFGVRNHMEVPGRATVPVTIRRWARRVGDHSGFMLDVRLADHASTTTVSFDRFVDIAHVKTVLNETPAVIKLPVNGDDVMRATGLKPGPAVGQILSRIADLVDVDPELTREVILARITEWWQTHENS